jgi:methyltransferase (TIGR00027 family)
MAKQTVGRTALGAATCRLIEQYQPAETRLLNDPVIVDLVGAPIWFLMQFGGMRRITVNQTDAVVHGLYGGQICRTRYIDDVVQADLEHCIDQIVILGAGLDTRPYRLPGLERVKVFEVDLPSVQADKKQKIEKHFGRLPGNVAFIPIDFDTQTLDAAFAGTGFDPARPAVYVWEGVTQYITQEAVSRTLAFVGKSAPGSRIAFTYVLKSVIERRSDIPNADHMMDTVAKTAPFIFGLEPAEIPAFLQTFHLALIEDVGNADYQEKYLKPLKRSLVVSEVEQVVHAVVKRS